MLYDNGKSKDILHSITFSKKNRFQKNDHLLELEKQMIDENIKNSLQDEQSIHTVSTEEEDLGSLFPDGEDYSIKEDIVEKSDQKESLRENIKNDFDLIERNEYLKSVKGLPPTCRNIFREEDFYFYLPKSDPLDYEMEFYLSPNTKITIELCLFVISNSSTQDPFLTFVLEKKEEVFSFPFLYYTHVITNKKLERKEDEDDDHSYETSIFNLILNKIFSLFEIQMDMKNKKQMKQFLSWRTKSYKGHLFNENTKTLQVVLDVSFFLSFVKLTKYLLSATLLKESEQWSVLHEIIHLKKLRDIPISPSVGSFFMEEKDALLLNIKNRFGSSTYIPFMMYSCFWQETEFVTSEDSDTILPPLSTHPNLGTMYFFSNYPLNGSKCPSKRFIVYPTKTIYMIKSLSLQLFDVDTFYNSVYFQEKKQPIWGILNASFFHEL